MFRIEAFCDDKMLAKMLWALSELGAYNVSSQPVHDATNGAHVVQQKTRQRAPLHRGELLSQWGAFVRKRKLREVAAPHIREFCTEIGYAAQSYGHVLKLLRAARLLSRKAGMAGPSNARYLVSRDKKLLAKLAKPEPKSAEATS